VLRLDGVFLFICAIDDGLDARDARYQIPRVEDRIEAMELRWNVIGENGYERRQDAVVRC